MFKDKLKQLRIERNLKQADVAKALGVTAATIGNYEQGLREPRNLEMWQKIADYFDVPVDDLMDKTEPSPLPKKHRRIIKPAKYEYVDSFWGYRTNEPIIYLNVDITDLVREKQGESILDNPERRKAMMQFTSLSGHALYARRKLIEIILNLEKKSREEIIDQLPQITKDIHENVIYWYKRCWNNIDDLFQEVTDLPSLYDLINVCLILDREARNIFYLVDIPDFQWLREKLR